MSELRKLDELKSHAQRAADQSLDPAKESERYEPGLRVIFKTHYYARLTEIEKSREAA